ncbi:aminopeptidase P family protein [Brevibacterium litoralis]|uniref:aminopeptidase P family protein n=1 Tax=Brevibacterium litoralis TaxID=3138935 RepID=UPI0032EB5844
MTESTDAQSTAQSTDQDLGNRVNNRSRRPQSKAFREFVASGWDHRPQTDVAPLESAAWTPARRAALSAQFPGERLVIPAGNFKQRSNDTDYRFRAHSAFVHLTGLDQDQEPDSVLVLEPKEDGEGHEETFYFRPRAGADTEEFFSDATYGEYWVGPRAELETMATLIGVPTDNIAVAAEAVTKDLGSTSVRIVRGVDSSLEAQVDLAREQVAADLEISRSGDDEMAQFLSELRLVKDDYEIERMREAVSITRSGFDEVVRALPAAVGHRRGERVLETSFERIARTEGYGLGYDTIAASGNHACTLHWIKNDGVVAEGDLVLVDAGAETDSLYTADITRTLPVTGTFTPVQRKIYEAVLEASDAAFARAAEHVHRDVEFGEIHDAAMEVIARRLEEWGLLPVTAEEALAPSGQQHRRWMVHGTSHHLGLDVHDCAQARAEMYLGAKVEPGMVFTIEPGLYFKEEDLLLPEEYRGIGVRIEDDVLVTAEGVENISAGFPRTADEVEAWVQGTR